jgi:glycosyltransferase involved in cell wall biosynthesis
MDMKILMIARKTLNSSPGGDTVQINSTAKYLRRLGVSVVISTGTEDLNYSDFNIIHFFNIIRPDDILSHIFRSKVPFVVSTVFVDYSEYERNRGGKIGLLSKVISSDILEYLKAIARVFTNGDRIKSSYYLTHGHKKSITYIVKRSKLLLPNSISEYQRLVRKYQVPNRFMKIVNAIDRETFAMDVAANGDYKDHVLCVGRIEGRKNQLNLIKAMVGSNLSLTIIGKPSPNHMRYFQDCKRIVSQNQNMQIIEHIDHEDLASIYKAAKVHVLPSWFETTGLSSLEAAIMDCNIVITKKGDAEEYFGDLAYYCEPDDLSTIRRAVEQAFAQPVNKSLSALVLEEYTWEKSAEQTLKGYYSVLNNFDPNAGNMI